MIRGASCGAPSSHMAAPCTSSSVFTSSSRVTSTMGGTGRVVAKLPPRLRVVFLEQLDSVAAPGER